MGKFSSTFWLATLCALIPWVSSASAHEYIVKEGENLSVITHSHLPGRVWGKDGNLRKVLDLNPWIQDPNLIYPENRVVLLRDTRTAPVPPDGPVAPEPRDAGIHPQPTLHERSSFSFSLVPSVQLTTLFSRDTATQSEATVASHEHFKLTGLYFQNWNERLQSFVGFTFGYFKAEAPAAASQSISTPSFFTSGVRAGLNGALSNQVRLEGYVAYEQELFVRSLSRTTVSVEKAAIPSVGSRLTYNLIEQASSSLGIGIASALLLPASTDQVSTRVGISYGGSIYHRQSDPRHGHPKPETTLGIYKRRQNTSAARQVETGLTLSVQIPLFVHD